MVANDVIMKYQNHKYATNKIKIKKQLAVDCNKQTKAVCSTMMQQNGKLVVLFNMDKA
jgi:hypothetical protein